MYKLKVLTKDEYIEYIDSCKNVHFMQSYEFGNIRKLKKFNPIYVALVDEKDNILCSALLLEKKLPMNYSYYYVPRGYTIDYDNFELLDSFTKELKSFAKKNKCIFIKIDPAIKLHNLDIDGNIVGEYNNFELVNHLKKIGYKHHGFNKMFENEEPRFTFRLGLDDGFDNIYSRFHDTTRKILNKNNQYELDIKKGDISDIEDFYITMIETAKREGILQASIDYYREFYKEFNQNNRSDLYIARVDIKKLKEIFNKKISSIEEEIRLLDTSDKYVNSSKNKNKKNELLNQLNRLNKDYSEIKDMKDEVIPLASIITVKYKDMVWTVHGGNNSVLMNLNANYLVYYEIIKDSYNEGYKCVDFFGTTGIANPDKSNPIYGIHNFKKRLGGEYTEFIGEFDLVVNKFMYFIFRKFVPILRKIKRKLGGGK